VLAAASCRRGATHPLVTHYNADHALTLQYPADWKSELAQQPDGSSYRYFMAPAVGSERRPAVTITLIAGPLAGPLETYAQSYVGANKVEGTRDEMRPPARGKSYRMISADGATRYSLLLLQEEARVYGLFTQAETRHFRAQEPAIEAIEKSFTLERYANYVDERNEKYGFALKMPPSWTLSRNFSGGGTFSKQYTSPAFAADKRQTIHASLTITSEPLPAGATLDTFYTASLGKLGEAYRVVNHVAWKDGYVDVVASETQVYMYRSKRFYRAADGRGITLSFEGRDDVYGRVARWCDMIAATLQVGPEVAATVQPAAGASQQ
jgi:hypothetical protein